MSDNDMDYAELCDGLSTDAVLLEAAWPGNSMICPNSPKRCADAVTAITSLRARVAELEADRQTLQRDGRHSAPCACHCEAAAFSAEIRLRDGRIAGLEAENKRLTTRLNAVLDEASRRERIGLYGGSE